MNSMNKAFVKHIVSLISNMNDQDSSNYIINVKYVIFLISKTLFNKKVSEYNSFNFILSKNSLNCDSLGILKQYSIFDLGIIEIEEKINSLIFDFKDTVYYDDFVPAQLYELLLTPTEKKTLGQVYTPSHLVEKMLSESFEINNIYLNMKILDPSCGGGYFLIQAFKKIREAFENESLDIDDNFILENMIYGVDIDDFSIFLTKMGLIFNSNIINANFNIINTDFLLGDDNLDFLFDIIIGNPPYIGHKQTNKDYKIKLKNKYSDVFYDKSDISYCFFKKGKSLLKDDGILCLITSRYFMEAMYADKLRNFIKNNFSIISIFDFNGFKAFKGTMISPVIIKLSNKVVNKNLFSYVKHNIDNSKIDKFTYGQTKLTDKGWTILDFEEEQLFNKIEWYCNTYINDVCVIKQGIITGYDKAFIVSDKEINEYLLEKDILKKWIKNSNISKTDICYKNMYLIYSNLIQYEEDYPNTIKYLKSYKNILMNRRECKNGIRKWYELQWGRVKSDFEGSKIIFPYKSDSNNFYIDNDEYFCSADIYIINEIHKDLSIEYLHDYLNSKLFEFYFKCQAKKVGANLYEYYPNKLNYMKIYLPDKKSVKDISNLGEIGIDIFLKKVFNINERESAIINKYITKKGDDAK